MGEQLFYYHSDHLGSTGYVTRENGKVHEHIQYFPFGETWVQQGGNTEKSPYLFTSKELDEETGLYYFGARYYDPKTSVWQSADPVLEKYLPKAGSDQKAQLPGMGGIFNTPNVALYTYAHNLPVSFIDPNGKWASQKGFYVHQRATYLLIGNKLGSSSNAVLASAHVYADSAQFQDVNSSFRHAMRAPGQTIEQAKQKADSFVRGQYEKAWSLKQAGKEKEALFEFGVALHTLQDSTSPSHHGFQEWEGEDVSTAEIMGHALAEMTNPGEGSELYKITNDAWSWFEGGQLPEGNIFDRYGQDGGGASPKEPTPALSDIVSP